MVRLIASTMMALVIAVVALPAYAADGGVIRIDIRAEREVVETAADGTRSTRLERVVTAVPGEELIYTIVYTNDGSDPAENVVVTDPLPADVAYVAGSQIGTGATFEVSADGGATWGAPGSVMVTDADGNPRPARADEYTHLRWILRNPVPPGGEGFVRFRATVR